ncbi:MAG TPA: DUF3488 and transglutaminase-like domain-containing protein [Candidatus Brocadiia bacterium]|nr:DUF3488 and transglutaminase-like domain-containing protein [Candidatus Brocadiia bacterium]
MKAERWLCVSLYFFIVLGSIPSALSESSMLYPLIASCVCIFHGAMRYGAAGGAFGRREVNILATLAAGFGLLDYFYISYDNITGIAHFLLILQLIKLLERKTPQDYITLYMAGVFEITVGAISTADIVFAPVFVAFIFSFLLNLSLWQFWSPRNRWDADRGNNGLNVAVGRISGLSGFIFAWLGLSLMVVAMTVALFFSLPRFETGWLLKGRASRSVRITGFSSNVQLGEVGRILQSDNVVMRVRIEGEGLDILKGRPLILRGAVLDSYENGRWRAWQEAFPVDRMSDAQWWLAMGPRTGLPPPRDLLPPISPVAGNFEFGEASKDTRFYMLRPWVGSPGRFVRVRETIYLQPNMENTACLFFVGDPDRIILPGVRRLQADLLSDTVRSSTPWYQTLHYIVEDRVPYMSSGMADSAKTLQPPAGWRDYPLACYWQVPDALKAKLAEFTRRIAPTGDGVPPYKTVKAVEDYFRAGREFEYSLVERRRRGAASDPIEEFLFNRKTGHCEYFASAMALCLRSVGIPARIVNGFKGGEWNAIAGVYVIRQKDAHSWVEVPFDGVGWIPFDPTAGGRASEAVIGQTASPFSLAFLSQFRQYAEVQWVSYIVSYDGEQRRNVFVTIRRYLESLSDYMPRFSPRRRGNDAARFIGWLMALALLGVGVWIIRGRLAWILSSLKLPVGRRRVSVEFYARALDRLRKRGFDPPQSMTPWEVFAAASTSLNLSPALDAQQADALENLTRLFCETQYGCKTVSGEQVSRAREWLRILSKKTD